MSEYFDVRGEVNQQGQPESVRDSTVQFGNRDDFSRNIKDVIQGEGRNMDRLKNNRPGFVNKLVCRPEGENTFNCEALYHDLVVTEEGLKSIDNIVVEANRKNVVRVKTEGVEVENKVLKTNE